MDNKNSFSRGIKNSSILTFTHFVVQIIAVFTSAYIARNLGPDKYGVYLTVGSLLAFSTIFLFKGLERVLVREGSEDTSKIQEFNVKLLSNTFVGCNRSNFWLYITCLHTSI